MFIASKSKMLGINSAAIIPNSGLQHPKSLRGAAVLSLIASVALGVIAILSLSGTAALLSTTVSYIMMTMSGALLVNAAILGCARQTSTTPHAPRETRLSVQPLSGEQSLQSPPLPLQTTPNARKTAHPGPKEVPPPQSSSQPPRTILETLVPDCPHSKPVDSVIFGQKALSVEVAHEIFKGLDPSVLCRCACVCTNWRNLLTDSYLWQQVAQTRGLNFNTYPTWRASCIEHELQLRVATGEKSRTIEHSFLAYQQYGLITEPVLMDHGNMLILLFYLKKTNYDESWDYVGGFKLIIDLCGDDPFGDEIIRFRTQIPHVPLGPKRSHIVTACVDKHRLIFGGPDTLYLYNLTLETYHKIPLQPPHNHRFGHVAVFNEQLLIATTEPQRESSSRYATALFWDIPRGQLLGSTELSLSYSKKIALIQNRWVLFRERGSFPFPNLNIFDLQENTLVSADLFPQSLKENGLLPGQPEIFYEIGPWTFKGTERRIEIIRNSTITHKLDFLRAQTQGATVLFEGKNKQDLKIFRY